MGVLAVGVGKVEEALPFFKTALEANSSIAQYWLSYIDALIKLDRMDYAKAVLGLARVQGAKLHIFDQLEERLSLFSSKAGEEVQKAAAEQSSILQTLKLDQAVKLAAKKAKEGSSDEAKRIYEDILVKFPKNKKAILGIKRLSGQVTSNLQTGQDPSKDQLKPLITLYDRGQLQRALDQAQVLSKLHPSSPILFNFQGAVFKGMGQLDLSYAPKLPDA
jgi:tetratricopeptide (TPR) repeat protein